MDKYQERIIGMIRDADFFFDAVQTAGNEVMRNVGYGRVYELIPGITVRYDLLDHGPENVNYYDQYAPDPDEYGEPVDLSKLDEHEAFLAKHNSYLRITIIHQETVVCVIEGPGMFHMSYHAEGQWEEKLLDWFRADGGVLR